ncbi:Ester hydrolase C11orf54 [Lamellibrachia satsuma]|nr:Ester hydrolase C11orf54 [Lamellibrachia satsuma]
MAMDTDIPVQKAALYYPPLEEVAGVLQDGLRENFANATVSVVDCPDLKQEPFMLAASGLCGCSRVADVGGAQNLSPTPKKDKLVANLLTEKLNESCTVKVDLKDQSRYILEKCSCTDCSLLLNIFPVGGKRWNRTTDRQVLEVKAANRTGDKDIILCMRKSLSAKYGDKLLGVGGVMLLEKGKAKIHVMPDFSEVPLNTEDDIAKWLNFYEMSAPLVCLGTFVTQVTDLDLRLQHFHCFSKHGDGGHFHTDTTPADAQYLGYFTLGESIVRLDRPAEKNTSARFEGE